MYAHCPIAPLGNGGTECKEEPNSRYRPSLPSNKTDLGQECGVSIGPISCLTTCCLGPELLQGDHGVAEM